MYISTHQIILCRILWVDYLFKTYHNHCHQRVFSFQNRALLRVANHLEVKKTVDAFKAKHKGKEDIIKTIIEQLGKKQRIKDAKVKQKKRALEKAAKRNPNKIKLDKRPADQNIDPLIRGHHCKKMLPNCRSS